MNSAKFNRRLGSILRRKRIEAGLKPKDIDAEYDLDGAFLREIEGGWYAPIPPYILYVICNLYGCSIQSVIDEALDA